jgi:hypothetical protein
MDEWVRHPATSDSLFSEFGVVLVEEHDNAALGCRCYGTKGVHQHPWTGHPHAPF